MPAFVDIPVKRICAWVEDSAPILEGNTPAPRFLDIASGDPDIQFIDPLQRRKLNRFSKGILHCAQRAWDGEECRIVLSSRYGDVARTLEMLEMMARGEEVSPTSFSLSVHNVPAAIFSLIKNLRAPICAMGAGEETFGWGLVAAALAWRDKPESPLLFLHGDDLLPEQLRPYRAPGEMPHAIACWIGTPAPWSIKVRWREHDVQPDPTCPGSLHFLARALRRETDEAWPGKRFSWNWDVDEARD
jgi:hypothetical protein